MFSDFLFVVQGVPQEGEGKTIISGDDTGREEHTKNPIDRFAFRTLTLRNVELTAPYITMVFLKPWKRWSGFTMHPANPDILPLLTR